MKILITAFLSIFLISSQGNAEDILEQFNEAKSLLNVHCATCIGKSRSGLLQGITKMEHVIQAGFTDVEAKSLLANAYNQMMIVFAQNQEEETMWAEKKKEFLSKALMMHPSSDDILDQYADTVESYPEKIEIYRKAFEINPKNTAVGYSLGVYLLEVGKKSEALDVFDKALLESEQGNTFTFGREMSQKLMIHGMKRESEEIEKLIDKIFKERNKAEQP